MRLRLFLSFLIALVLIIMAGCTTSVSQESPANKPDSKPATIGNPIQQSDSPETDEQSRSNLTVTNKPLPEAGINKLETGAGENVQSTSGELTAKDLSSMLTSGEKLVLIDVNPITDYKEGHVKGAIWGDFKFIRTSTPEPYLSQLGIKRTDTIVLICEIGNKSAIAVPFLVKAGYSKVYSLKDGNIGWIRAGFKLEK